MTPVFDAILNADYSQVFWNQNDVERYQITVLHRSPNQFNLGPMGENSLGGEGSPMPEQFIPPLRGEFRRFVGMTQLVSRPVLRRYVVGIDELQRYRGEDPVKKRCLAGPVRSGNDVENWIRH